MAEEDALMFQLQGLEGFYWVARMQGYARAARAFPYPITEPGLHQQVSRIESNLGVKLFERVAKDRVILTPRGRLLYEFAAPFFEQLPDVEHLIRSGQSGGTLRIDTSPHLLRYLLPPWLRRIQSKSPEVNLEVVEVKVPNPERIWSGEADLLVDHLPKPPKDLGCKKIAVAKAFLALPSQHPLLKGRRGPVLLGELANETFIAYGTDLQARELQLMGLRLHGIVPRRVHSAESAESILGFVAAGLGYSLVPSVLAGGPGGPGIAAQPVTRPAAEFPIYAVWRKSAPNRAIVSLALSLAPQL
jgi:DNA-binding transcriptional LysR family regulator